MMNTTTNTLSMTGPKPSFGQRFVSETLRLGAKKSFYAALVICAVVAECMACPQATQASAGSQSQAAGGAASGQHDFDFCFGTWKTHISLLAHPLSGSTTRIELDGTVKIRKVWGGNAYLEELDDGSGATRFQGLALFLYNSASHQWSQSFSRMDNGTLSQPLIGEFKNGRGEFFKQDQLNGRAILVRFVWSDITPDSYHEEQSFSDDGGKTWEPNFVATLTREAN